MRISDWSSDVCSSDLAAALGAHDSLDPGGGYAEPRRGFGDKRAPPLHRIGVRRRRDDERGEERDADQRGHRKYASPPTSSRPVGPKSRPSNETTALAISRNSSSFGSAAQPCHPGNTTPSPPKQRT